MTKVCILIVEDEVLLSMDLEEMLVGAGYAIAGEATDMHQAVALCERHGGRIDIALMDVNLARGTNGVETARILRERWNIPSLFISGNIDDGMRESATGLNPAGFLGKPFSERAILTALAAAFPADICKTGTVLV